MSNASIIDRIRKLRALATSDNLNEATAAARAAEKLLQQYALSESDVAVVDDEAPIAEDCITFTSSKIPAWQNVLSYGLVKQYQCDSVVTNRHAGNPTIRVFGRRQDVETFRYQYAFYAAEIVRLCNRLCAGKGRSYRVAFCAGAVDLILQSLRDATREVRAEATSTALARVDARAAAASLALRAAIPNVRSASSTRRVDATAYRAGQAAAATIRKGGVLGAGGARLLSA